MAIQQAPEVPANLPTPGSGASLTYNSTTNRWEFKGADANVYPASTDVDEVSVTAAASVTITPRFKFTSVKLPGLSSGNEAVTLNNGIGAGDLCAIYFTGTSGSHDITVQTPAPATIAKAAALGSSGTAAVLLFWTGAAWVVLMAMLNGAPASIGAGVITAAGGSSATILQKASDTSRIGGTFSLDPDLQVAIAANEKMRLTGILFFDGSGGGQSGNLGMLAPTGCKVTAAFNCISLSTGTGSPPLQAPLALKGVDGSSLASNVLSISEISNGPQCIVYEAEVVNGSTAGTVGIAFNGGSMQLDASSTMVWEPTS